MTNRLRKRTMNGPPAEKPIPNCAIRQPKPFAMFRSNGHNSVKRVHFAKSLISGLSFWICPSAIARFISTIAINSIQRAANWLVPHIVIKFFKRFPSFAYAYSAPTIKMEIWIVWVFASLLHPLPYPVRRSLPPSSGESMLKASSRRYFTKQTSTRKSFFAFKGGIQNGKAVSADAITQTGCYSPTFFGFAWFTNPNNSKSCKHRADGNSFEFRHGVLNQRFCLALGDRRQPALNALIQRES